MKNIFSKITFLLLISFRISAQMSKEDSVKFYEHRFAFAKMYVGLEMYGSTSSGTTSVLTGTTTSPISFDGFRAPRIIWGATHFWGHADIFVAFPIGSNTQTPQAPLTYTNFTEDVETGFKIYPSALRPNTIRPYIGASWLPVSYRQQSQGDKELGFNWSKNLVPINLGVSYSSKRFVLDAGVQYLASSKFQYPLSRTVYGNLDLPNLNFSIGLKYLIETTKKPLDVIERKIRKLRGVKNIMLSTWESDLLVRLELKLFRNLMPQNILFWSNVIVIRLFWT